MNYLLLLLISIAAVAMATQQVGDFEAALNGNVLIVVKLKLILISH